MKFRRLPKPKLQWFEDGYSEEEQLKYEESLVNVAMQEAETNDLRQVIIYLMENKHPDTPHKQVGTKKKWNTHLKILLACEFELIDATNQDKKAEILINKSPLWKLLLETDDGIGGLVKKARQGRNNKLFNSEGKFYLENPTNIQKSLIHELNTLGFRTDSI